MSLIKLTKGLISRVSTTYRPQIEYISSSVSGESGDGYISNLSSNRIKNINSNTTLDSSAIASDNAGLDYSLGNISKAFDSSHVFDGSQNETQNEIPILFNDILSLGRPAAFSTKRKIKRISFDHDTTITSEYSKKTIHQAFVDVNNVYAEDAIVALRLGEKNVSDLYNSIITWNTTSQDTYNSKSKLDYVRSHLLNEYKSRYNNSFYGFTNYNSLNFFESDSVSSDTCLIYPNRHITDSTLDKNVYNPTDKFVIDFFIKPKDNNGTSTSGYTAGTIMHMSSSFCVSLVSGSLKDADNKPKNFRVMLQLFNDSNISPTNISIDNINNTLAGAAAHYISNDYLKKDNWHRVTIAWSNNYNNNIGTIQIDNSTPTNFSFPSSSISESVSGNSFAAGREGFFIGNYYDGPPAEVVKFFNNTASQKNGIFTNRLDGSSYTNSPGGSSDANTSNFNFLNPLNAEIHDLKIYKSFRGVPSTKTFLSPADITSIRENGVMFDSSQQVLPDFYVPVYFTPNVGSRLSSSDPFGNFISNGVTYTSQTTPTNLDWNLSIGGHYLNLENFCKEYVQNNFPRLYNLDLPTNSGLSQVSSTKNYLYEQPEIRKRNLSILPNDNGKCVANYECLKQDLQFTDSLTTIAKKQAKDVQLYDMNYYGYDQGLQPSNNSTPGSINISGQPPDGKDIYFSRILLRNQVADDNIDNIPINGELYLGLNGSESSGEIGHLKDSVIANTLGQRHTDDVTIFSISNAFYGEKIHPGSFELVDNDLTGSSGRLSIKIKDDGKGSLYRSDAVNTSAKWASIGNIFYDEGIVLIKHPSLKYIGSDDYSIKFKGEQTSHTMIINAPAPADLITSSSNASYQVLSASADIADAGEKFVYISGINIHDENLNVIMRTNLAQPVVKKRDDELVFKLKMDF